MAPVGHILLFVVLGVVSPAAAADTDSGLPAVLLESQRAAGATATSCPSAVDPAWDEYSIGCAIFEADFSEFNAAFHNRLQDAGHVSVFHAFLVERRFPERRDQFYAVAALGYMIESKPVLVLSHEYGKYVVIAAGKDSGRPGLRNAAALKQAFPGDHPLVGLDIYIGLRRKEPVLGDLPEDAPTSRVLAVEAQYPIEARGRELSATVVVMVTIDKEGRVSNVEIMQTDDPGVGFNEAAMEAARMCRYRPHVVYGLPYEDILFQKFEFAPPVGDEAADR